MSSGVSLDIWDEPVPSSPAESASKLDYYMQPVNRPGPMPSPSGGEMGPRREPHAGAPAGFPGQRPTHGQAPQRGAQRMAPQPRDPASHNQASYNPPSHYQASHNMATGDKPVQGVSWQQHQAAAPVRNDTPYQTAAFPPRFPGNPDTAAPAAPATFATRFPGNQGAAAPGPAPVSRNFYNEIRNGPVHNGVAVGGGTLEHYGGPAQDAATSQCRASHDTVTIRDFFWVKCCIVVCMILLLIIVFQLNRICRHLSEKK